MDFMEYLNALRGAADPQRVAQEVRGMWDRNISLDDPNVDLISKEGAQDFLLGFVPGTTLPMAARDFERARREGSGLGMLGAAVSALPAGLLLKKGGKAIQNLLPGSRTQQNKILKDVLEAEEGLFKADPNYTPSNKNIIIDKQGRARLYVPDVDASLDVSKIPVGMRSKHVPLSQVMDHAKMREMGYGDIMDEVNIRFVKPEEYLAGKVSPQRIEALKKSWDGALTPGNEIVLNFYKYKGQQADFVKPTVLHELQHYIQRKEAFARGGSKDDVTKRFQAAQAYAKENPEFAKDWTAYMSNVTRHNPKIQEALKNRDMPSFYHALYEALQGEGDARAVESMWRVHRKNPNNFNPQTQYMADMLGNDIVRDEYDDITKNALSAMRF